MALWLYPISMALNDFDRDNKELLRREAAAAWLGISVATLARLVRAGRLQVVRVLGRPRYRLTDLAAVREPK